MTTDELADALAALAEELRQCPGMRIVCGEAENEGDRADYGEAFECDLREQLFKSASQPVVRWWHRWEGDAAGWLTDTPEPPPDDGDLMPAVQVLVVGIEPEGKADDD